MTSMVNQSISLAQVVMTAEQQMNSGAFKDYCPNGLQVEGRSQVRKLVSGVTASLAFVEQAIAAGADALLVHHGYFWRGEAAEVVGVKKRRLQALLQADVSLLAYHLPLDAHAKLGNNVQLAKRLGWIVEDGLEPGNPRSIGLQGRLSQALPINDVLSQLADLTGRTPLLVGQGKPVVSRIAWCTGAAQSMLEQAAAIGAEVFVSGEISEQTVHLANELGLYYIAAGHHATERYGVQALGDCLAEQLGIVHQFIDLPNPV
ncbi:Nif3-like dinuclear metal center hexameric protein [Pokkaliibacter sp. MBI-7]|nr:Nif3-like dinuclear metal center hexameric protein [Pokkaliibacter sp. MBI-7]MDH2431648.1 Nif3-like dinuclear metal center hexameric protein [Pokkaliibacter sp. MBI-7]